MADFSKITPRSIQVSDDLTASLERMIVSGEIAVGERLPAERALAEDLGVSRASVRESMRELELRGLIDRRPGRGTVVLDPARTDLSGGLIRRLGELERSMREVMDLRAVIEPPIAARAAQRATARDLRTLRELVEAMRSTSSVRESTRLDVRFHYEIARSTHNPLLVKMIEIVSDWVDESRSSGSQTKRRREVASAAHAEIVDRIAERDSIGAANAMARHIEAVNEMIVEAQS